MVGGAGDNTPPKPLCFILYRTPAEVLYSHRHYQQMKLRTPASQSLALCLGRTTSKSFGAGLDANTYGRNLTNTPLFSTNYLILCISALLDYTHYFSFHISTEISSTSEYQPIAWAIQKHLHMFDTTMVPDVNSRERGYSILEPCVK